MLKSNCNDLNYREFENTGYFSLVHSILAIVCVLETDTNIKNYHKN